jgi:hypothetical protein
MTTPKTLSSDTAPPRSWPVVVLEGMPGAGKTTASEKLAAEGRLVVGEYMTSAGLTIPITDHPTVDDDAGHQANWLIKHRHARLARRTGAVYCDRDWLSALAYAASVEDGGPLLRARAIWASERMLCGDLSIASTYVVFGLHPATSLRRRVNRLTPNHPWSSFAGLQRLAAFYADPIDAVGRVDEGLAHALRAATWHQVSDRSLEQTLRFLRDLTNRP